MSLKRTLVKTHWVLSAQFGLNIRLFFNAFCEMPNYLKTLYKFSKNYSGRIKFAPCLHDRAEEGGVTKSEYFLQDLFVARRIFKDHPVCHVDVGSRVDGFVAHVASFRDIEVFDVRTITAVIPGIIFRQGNFMDTEATKSYQDLENGGYCDSLSRLHAIEHFGLGRYGDPIDPIGYQRGINNLSSLLAPEGTLYLSTPIGQERVEFNANWVFDPRTIIRCANQNSLHLEEFWSVDVENSTVQQHSLSDIDINQLAHEYYRLGLFIFKKKKNVVSTQFQ
jgi:hypothetical protein